MPYTLIETMPDSLLVEISFVDKDDKVRYARAYLNLLKTLNSSLLLDR